ncbi:pleiotropic drug resistance protein 3-like [Gossypium australe]|uniref:Pleiotropic drug resistance protein 3-like n=1 Tax=Gossypium australe TaxID=47621 RepID=A0A5B6WIX3_9ROSI|nr:pleiotropic drug resistance protein 3-like [Gossypium australe]
MLFTLKSKEELVNKKSIKKVPSKPKANLPRTPLATKGRRPNGARKIYPPRSHYRRLSYLGENCWFRPNLQRKVCKKMGHVDKVCRNKGKLNQNQLQQPRVEAQVAKEGCEQEISCSAAKRKATKGWLIGSGCTNCMTPNAAIFKNIDRSFKTMGESIKLVSNVLFVPKIDRNLLSIAQLLEKGYSVVFKGKECLISDPSGSKLMLVVDWNKSSDKSYTTILDESKLWHKRLGHVNYKSLTQLTKEDMVENFTNSVEKEDVCEVCHLGKQARLPFPSNKAWRASERLQLVHADVCGPMKTLSLNGSKYFILFIDDYSRSGLSILEVQGCSRNRNMLQAEDIEV